MLTTYPGALGCHAAATPDTQDLTRGDRVKAVKLGNIKRYRDLQIAVFAPQIQIQHQQAHAEVIVFVMLDFIKTIITFANHVVQERIRCPQVPTIVQCVP